MEEDAARVVSDSLTQGDPSLLFLHLAQRLRETYQPGNDRVVSPDNVYQAGIAVGREELEEFALRLLLPGSRVEGLCHLDSARAEVRAGRSVLFMAEHRGNLDVPTFNALLRREHTRYHDVLERLVYVAGRKLNESSDFIKMFAEKYSRLIIVPRRDHPKPTLSETAEETAAREAFRKAAGRINRSAFRQLLRLKRAGRILVLFPLGGRLKPGVNNVPVPESASYVRLFDSAYLVSMEGNTMPPLPRMEDERPIRSKVVFRVGPVFDCRSFLVEQRALFDEALHAGILPHDFDPNQFTVANIMTMLGNLRLTGSYGNPLVPRRVTPS